jgi:outer membrane lipoprotein carrier protein LolA
MRITARCALVCALLYGGMVHAQAPAALDEVMQLLAKRTHGHVAFTEVHTLAMLKQPLNSSGELIYDAPDRLQKRTLEPRPESLQLDHGELTLERGHRKRVVALKDYPQVIPFVESIRATLAGDRPSLERYFNLHFAGTPAGWTLELQPRDPQVSATVQQVRIEGAQGAIRSVRIRQSDGDESLLTIGADLAP